MKCLSVDIYTHLWQYLFFFSFFFSSSFFFFFFFFFLLAHDFVVVDNVQRRELVNVYSYSAV